jgi:hypothetical protein
MMNMDTAGAAVKRSAYADFDVHAGDLAKLPHPTRKQALWVAKRVWRRAVGKAWPGKWVAGRGNHRSYSRMGRRFLVNPGQGWSGIIHDMSHDAFEYLTMHKGGDPLRFCSPAKLADYATARAGNRHHNANHAALERQMVAHARELIGKLQD